MGKVCGYFPGAFDLGSMRVWFWQRIVTPHMAYLAIALADRGIEVVYITEEAMAPERVALGWSAPVLKGVHLEFAASSGAVGTLVASASADSVHICQGVRSNGLVHEAQRALARRKLRQWVVMETVDDHRVGSAF